MKRFRSALGLVELTDEREQHIFTFHPEVRNARKYFAAALARPETIRKSKYDDAVIICYGRLPAAKKFLAIAVKKTQARNFILTAYLTDRIQHLPL